MGKVFITTTQAADKLGVTPATVYAWFHNGTLPGVRGASGQFLFNCDDVKQLKSNLDEEKRNTLSSRELAELLGLKDPQTIANYVHAGLLPNRKNANGAFVFYRDEIDEWVEKTPKLLESLMTSKQVSRYIGISHNQVLELNENNKLPRSSFIKGLPHFKRTEIEEWFGALGKKEPGTADLLGKHRKNLILYEKQLHLDGQIKSKIKTNLRYIRYFLIWLSNSFGLLLEPDVISVPMLETYEAFLETQFKQKSTRLKYVIGLRDYFRWTLDNDLLVRSPFDSELAPIDLSPFLDWLQEQGYSYITAKAYRSSIPGFYRWFCFARRSEFSPAAATPDTFESYWAHERAVRRLSPNSRCALVTALKRFAQFGVDKVVLSSDPWAPLSKEERSIKRKYLQYLEREGYTKETIRNRENAFLRLLDWFHANKRTSFDAKYFSVDELPAFDSYMKIEKGFSPYAREKYLGGARNVLDWLGKLTERDQFLELAPDLIESMEKELSDAETQGDKKNVRKLKTLLYIGEGASLNKTSEWSGVSRVTICRWILDLAEQKPDLVTHCVQRPSLEIS